MHIFHEGMPGSGKSYEALISHIIPSVKKGRKVYARINGLNYEKISELCEITVDRCKELLIHIPEEQVTSIYDHVENDSIVIIDELQNFFPSGRNKLSPEITKFITEHRHRGLDIVTMGQSIADVHQLWRRRTQRKIQFLKLDMVGQDSRYKWTAYQGTLDGKGDVKFTKIKTGVRKYEEKYFGSYASHQSDTENTDNYKDDRLNIFKTSTFKFVIPAAVLLAAYSLYYLLGFFDTDKENDAQPVAIESLNQKQLPDGLSANVPPTEIPKPHPPTKKEVGFDYVVTNNDRYNFRISYIELKRDYVVDMTVVWYDNRDKVKDRISARHLRKQGYKLTYLGYGVEAAKDDYKVLYRVRPRFEPSFTVPDTVENTLDNS